ncbi:MAG: hypothetical protein RMJ17_01875 [Candidatus Aenigmarchaeota archaeon]|nr:hypothetical protein [Candidatus Aenigmarchaeota archaeon]MDW8149324.1 hypothetical protein [Candidatus Aenigmarchaeota archaeon]
MVRAKKAKVWIDIVAPKIFNEKTITKTLASEEENFIGRTLEFPLYLLDENKKDKFYYMAKLRIVEVNEEKKAKTTVEGIRVLKNYLEKFVTSGVASINHVKDLDIQDGKKIRVKVFVALEGKPNDRVKTTIRKEIEKFVEEKFKNYDFDFIVKNVIEDGIKNELLKTITKVYPVKVLEIKEIKVL